MPNFIEDRFFDFMVTRCSLKHISAYMYLTDIRRLSKIMVATGMVNTSIFEIKNLHELKKKLIDVVETDEFKNLKNHGHQYGNTKCAMRHYYDYAASDTQFDASSLKTIRIV